MDTKMVTVKTTKCNSKVEAKLGRTTTRKGGTRVNKITLQKVFPEAPFFFLGGGNALTEFVSFLGTFAKI